MNMILTERKFRSWYFKNRYEIVSGVLIGCFMMLFYAGIYLSVVIALKTGVK